MTQGKKEGRRFFELSESLSIFRVSFLPLFPLYIVQTILPLFP